MGRTTSNDLSMDDLFNVLEFLPIQDIGRALLVCREWNHSLDYYEPFWKMILTHFLSSNIIQRYEQYAQHCLTNKEESSHDFKSRRELSTMLNSTDHHTESSRKGKSILIASMKHLKIRKNSPLLNY